MGIIRGFISNYITFQGVARLRESLKTAQEHPDGGKIVLRETLNSARLLTRITPLLYEDVEWIGFYHSKIPSESGEGVETKTLAEDIVEVGMYPLTLIG